jgi:hypothetical protein
MNRNTDIVFGRVAGITRPIAIANGAGRCRLAHQLHNIEQSARSRLRKIPIGDLKRSIPLGQLGLMVQRLRNEHLDTCPDCGRHGEAGQRIA